MNENPDCPTELGDVTGQKHLQDIQGAAIVMLIQRQKGRSKQFASAAFVYPSATRSRSFLQTSVKRKHSPDLNGTCSMPADAN